MFKFLRKKKHVPTSLERAKLLVQAVDRGGIPLDATRVNAIGRSLGLEVSTTAPVQETIERIRTALARVENALDEGVE